MFLPWSSLGFVRFDPYSKKMISTLTSTRRTVDLIKSGLIDHGFTWHVISASQKFFLRLDNYSYALWLASSWLLVSKKTIRLLASAIWSWELRNGGRPRSSSFVPLPKFGQTSADLQFATKNILDLIGSPISTGETPAVSSLITRPLSTQLRTLCNNWQALSASTKFCWSHS